MHETAGSTKLYRTCIFGEIPFTLIYRYFSKYNWQLPNLYRMKLWFLTLFWFCTWTKFHSAFLFVPPCPRRGGRWITTVGEDDSSHLGDIYEAGSQACFSFHQHLFFINKRFPCKIQIWACHTHTRSFRKNLITAWKAFLSLTFPCTYQQSYFFYILLHQRVYTSLANTHWKNNNAM